MTIVLISQAENGDTWAAELRQRDPGLDIRVWPEETEDLDPAAVSYVIAALPPHGEIARFPNLKAVLSLWAGLDHITGDPSLPEGVPIVRMIEEGLTRGMREFVLAQALMAHLSIPSFMAQQRRGEWRPQIRGAFGTEPLVDERTVGVLGLGVLGTDCARALAATGFRVAGWARSEKRIDGVDCYHGDDRRDALLARAEILVNLLPRTPETENILDAALFDRLPEGAYLINVGRGEHLVEDDLLRALDEGRLSGAALDVFRAEPLPADHPFWRHEKIVVTPHVASITRVRTGAARLLDVMATIDEGGTPDGTFDPMRGY